MALLWEESRLEPSRCLAISPSIMNMLKSSPMPNMKVASIMLTMLNSIPSIAISPRMTTQPASIGRKARIASSRRPYEIQRARKTIIEDMYNMKLKSPDMSSAILPAQ